MSREMGNLIFCNLIKLRTNLAAKIFVLFVYYDIYKEDRRGLGTRLLYGKIS